MQDWDRLVMIAVGVLVSLYTAWDSRSVWKNRNYVAIVGVAILIAAAIGVPILLSIFAT